MKNLLPLLLLILMITSCEKEIDESMLDSDLIEMDLMNENDQSDVFYSNSGFQEAYDRPFSPHGPVAPPCCVKTTPEGDAGRLCLDACETAFAAIIAICELDPDCDSEGLENDKIDCRRDCYD